jgi:hypothetical protein
MLTRGGHEVTARSKVSRQSCRHRTLERLYYQFPSHTLTRVLHFSDLDGSVAQDWRLRNPSDSVGLQFTLS